jgi:hypothetical protein
MANTSRSSNWPKQSTSTAQSQKHWCRAGRWDGHPCPSSLTYEQRQKPDKLKFKSDGQECPLHPNRGSGPTLHRHPTPSRLTRYPQRVINIRFALGCRGEISAVSACLFPSDSGANSERGQAATLLQVLRWKRARNSVDNSGWHCSGKWFLNGFIDSL